MRLTASSYVHRAAWQDAREHKTRFLEYKTACRAPIRTCTDLYGSVTSAWVKVLPQSELMGPSSAGFAPCTLLRPYDNVTDLTGAAIDMLIEV